MISNTNHFVFKLLHIVAWILFIGLCIEAGGLIVNFIVSIVKPEFVKNLYQKLDLSNIYAKSKWLYFSTYSFIIVIAVLKAILFYKLVSMMLRLNLDNPFTDFVAKNISMISYIILSIGFISYSGRYFFKKYLQQNESIWIFLEDNKAFILTGSVVYIISIIFKKGIELQRETDLTV